MSAGTVDRIAPDTPRRMHRSNRYPCMCTPLSFLGSTPHARAQPLGCGGCLKVQTRKYRTTEPHWRCSTRCRRARPVGTPRLATSTKNSRISPIQTSFILCQCRVKGYSSTTGIYPAAGEPGLGVFPSHGRPTAIADALTVSCADPDTTNRHPREIDPACRSDSADSTMFYCGRT